MWKDAGEWNGLDLGGAGSPDGTAVSMGFTDAPKPAFQGVAQERGEGRVWGNLTWLRWGYRTLTQPRPANAGRGRVLAHEQ